MPFKSHPLSTNESPFDSFVHNATTNEVTVCGKKYTCRRNDDLGTSYWSSIPKFGPNEAPSRECKVDILAAAGLANNCDVKREMKSFREDCAVPNPFMTNGTSIAQVRGDRSNRMPSILEGSWTCLAKGDVTEKSHKPSHTENQGGLTMLFVTPSKHPVEEPPTDDPPEPDDPEPPQEEPPPTETGSMQDNPDAPPSDDTEPMDKPYFQPDRDPVPVFGASNTRDDGGWFRCRAPNTVAQACRIDADCKLSPSQYKDILWSKMADVAKLTDMKMAVAHIQKNISDEVTWDEANASARASFTTRAEFKKHLMTLWDSDESFRASMERVIDTDPDFTTLRANSGAGKCMTGKCAVRKVRPNTRLYSGPKDTSVTFSLDEYGDRVNYTKNGISREARAMKCDDSNRLVCDAALPLETLELSTQGVRESYRVTFGEDEYVVMNQIATRDSSRCAMRICEHNQGTCPSSLCKLDEDQTCVPKE